MHCNIVQNEAHRPPSGLWKAYLQTPPRTRPTSHVAVLAAALVIVALLGSSIAVPAAASPHQISSTPCPTWRISGSRAELASGAGTPTGARSSVSATLAQTNAIGSPAYSQSTIPVGSNPWGVAYAPGANLVFVSNEGSGNVSVINPSTDRIVGSFAVGSGPYGITYDPAANTLYVANSGSGTVSVVSASSYTPLVAPISVGGEPHDALYDSSTGTVFVSNSETDRVSVIDATDNAVTTTISVGSKPTGMALDPVSDSVYVANDGSDTISVIAAASNDVSTRRSQSERPRTESPMMRRITRSSHPTPAPTTSR